MIGNFFQHQLLCNKLKLLIKLTTKIQLYHQVGHNVQGSVKLNQDGFSTIEKRNNGDMLTSMVLNLVVNGVGWTKQKNLTPKSNMKQSISYCLNAFMNKERHQ